MSKCFFINSKFICAFFQQFQHVFTQTGVDEGGGYFCHGGHDEPPVLHMGMGYREAGQVDDLGIVHNDVDVDDPGSEFFAPKTSKFLFYIQNFLKQRGGR